MYVYSPTQDNSFNLHTHACAHTHTHTCMYTQAARARSSRFSTSQRPGPAHTAHKIGCLSLCLSVSVSLSLSLTHSLTHTHTHTHTHTQTHTHTHVTWLSRHRSHEDVNQVYLQDCSTQREPLEEEDSSAWCKLEAALQRGAFQSLQVPLVFRRARARASCLEPSPVCFSPASSLPPSPFASFPSYSNTAETGIHPRYCPAGRFSSAPARFRDRFFFHVIFMCTFYAKLSRIESCYRCSRRRRAFWLWMPRVLQCWCPATSRASGREEGEEKEEDAHVLSRRRRQRGPGSVCPSLLRDVWC